DSDVTNTHRTVERLDLHALLAGSHPMTSREDRIPDLPTESDVTANAINYGTGYGAEPCRFGQDLAPNGRILPAAIVQSKYRAGGHSIDEITHCPGGVSCRPIENRERSADHTEGRRQ